MTRAARHALAGLLAAATLALAAAPAHAQSSALADAERAYLDVDFDETLAAAQRAIDAGGLTPSELARAYELLGVSASALGDSAAARDCFLRMLSIDAERRLDDTVPPRLRAPFLEARGALSARTETLGAEVGLARAYGSVRVTLTDPFEMVQTVRVHLRTEGGVAFTDSEEPFDREIMVRFSGASTGSPVEYWLELVDPRGNQVLVLGSEFEPRVLGRAAVVAGAGGEGSEAGGGGGGGPGILGEPVFWIIVGSVVAVGAAVGIGVGVAASSQVGLTTGVSF